MQLQKNRERDSGIIHRYDSVLVNRRDVPDDFRRGADRSTSRCLSRHGARILRRSISLGCSFDVIPEALDLLEASQSRLPHQHLLFACALGFLVFYLFEHTLHHEHAHNPDSVGNLRHKVGTWGALGIGIHSFFDGVAIGGAFQAGNEMGWVVAAAVMVHKIADGASSVGVMLSTRHSVSQIIAVLSATAIAPLIGTTVQSAFVMPTPLLALVGFRESFYI
jgi:ZIP family zinc transporter